MAATVNIASNLSEQSSIQHSPKLTTIKSLSESGLTSIPSSFVSKCSQNLEAIDTAEGTIPIIDFSLLTSTNTQERCKVIQELGKACEEWGFFLVHCWRDFLKVFVHPEFHFPHKPAGFSDIAFEYTRRIRVVASELLKGISESLGFEAEYISKAVNFDSGLQIFAVNLYPPCPQPELAVGIHPHSDHGMMTILLENGLSGLQTLHNGKWTKVNALPNALMVNTADQLEVVSNGKYRSNVHRAALYSNDSTRMTLVSGFGPSLEQVISPAPELVNETQSPAFTSVTFREYYEIHQSNSLNMKSALDHIRIPS